MKSLDFGTLASAQGSSHTDTLSSTVSVSHQVVTESASITASDVTLSGQQQSPTSANLTRQDHLFIPSNYSVQDQTTAGSLPVSLDFNLSWVDPKIDPHARAFTQTSSVQTKFDRWGDALEVTDARNAAWKTIYTYNAAGQVFTQSKPNEGGAASVSRATYDRQGHTYTLTDANNGTQSFRYDSAGNLIAEKHADGSQRVHRQSVRHVGYDATMAAHDGDLIGNVDYGYDATGNLSRTSSQNFRDPGGVTVTLNTWQAIGDSDKQVYGNSDGGGTHGDVHQVYDGAGRLLSLTHGIKTDTNPDRRFYSDAEGHVLLVRQLDGAGKDLAGPGHIERFTVIKGEQVARAADSKTEQGYTDAFGQFDAIEGSPGVAKQASGARAYVVQDGDTLQKIAQAVYGDASLWYVIAQANGITSLTAASKGNTDGLAPGRVLTIPDPASVGAGTRNSASTFRPYDPSQALGDTGPALAAPAQSSECGGMGQIIMVIVAIVVTIYSGPEGLDLLNMATATDTALDAASQVALQASEQYVAEGAMEFAANAAATSVADLAVAESTLAMTKLASVAVSAALGNAASQAVGNLLGVQHGFSFKSMVASALSAGLGDVASSYVVTANPLASVVAKAAVRSALGQGVNIVLGLQRGFSWSQTASAMVAAPVAQAAGELAEDAIGNGSGFVGSAAYGIASQGVTHAVAGGRIGAAGVINDAFGFQQGLDLIRQMEQAAQGQQGRVIGNAIGQTLGEDKSVAPAANVPFLDDRQLRGAAPPLPELSEMEALNQVLADNFRPSAVDRGDVDVIAGADGVSLERSTRQTDARALHRNSERQYRTDLETVRSNSLGRTNDGEQLRSALRRLGLDDPAVRRAYRADVPPGPSQSLPDIDPGRRFVGGVTTAIALGWGEARNPANNLGERAIFGALALAAVPDALVEGLLYAPLNVVGPAQEGAQHLARARLQTDPDARNLDIIAAVGNLAEAFSNTGAWLVGPRPSAAVLRAGEDAVRTIGSYGGRFRDTLLSSEAELYDSLNARRAEFWNPNVVRGKNPNITYGEELFTTGRPREVTVLRTGEKVAFDASGSPILDPYLYQGPSGTANVVRIRMTGKLADDFSAANAAAGLPRTPENYVWHHHQDLGVLQLVRRDVHDSVRHSGGVSFYNALVDAGLIRGPKYPR